MKLIKFDTGSISATVGNTVPDPWLLLLGVSNLNATYSYLLLDDLCMHFVSIKWYELERVILSNPVSLDMNKS